MMSSNFSEQSSWLEWMGCRILACAVTLTDGACVVVMTSAASGSNAVNIILCLIIHVL